MKIAIIGAGIAGITVARELTGAAEVTVFEKSRGVGGRMSTRREGDWQFDHGAQFFTARSPQFRQFINELRENEVIAEWIPKVVTLQAGKKPFKREWFEPHYVAKPAMNSLLKFMADDLNVRLQTAIVEISQQNGSWILADEGGAEFGDYDSVISALPAPQSLVLLAQHCKDSEELKKVRYSPCFALMLGCSNSSGLNFDVAVVRESPLAWVAVNASRPERSDNSGLIVHSANEWAEAAFDQATEWVNARLLRAIEDVLGLQAGQFEHIELQRWRYARVEDALARPYLMDKDKGLAACGDWCLGSRVEDAFLSGLALAEGIREEYKI
ncbi:MAG: FAD-dependent oxidoreductase [Gammaproteobacteria bacterium]|nr:FAD-dependent oxidoreductase [Gammaproteobacteria bacterium]